MRTYAVGLYHQRCGTGNALPFTRFTHAPCHAAAASVPLAETNFTFTWTTISNYSVAITDSENPPQAHPLTNAGAQLYPIRKTGTIDVSGGHHDAGDYSKYTINVAALIHDLVFAADNIAGAGVLDNLGIPESGDGKSDLLQEAKWEADFLAKMQDDDGGFFFLVYPRNREYEDNVLPDQGDPQVVWPKTTSATAAAVAALAETGSSPLFRQQFRAAADSYLAKATLGWNFLISAINTWGYEGSYQKITHYGDWRTHKDELAWAAAAMYAATGNPAYQTKLMEWFPNPNDWLTYRDTWLRMFAGYGCAIRDYSFAVRSGRLTAGQLNAPYLAQCDDEVLGAGQDALTRYQQTAYGTSFPSQSKSWNGGVAGWYFSSAQAFDMVAAHLLSPNSAYLPAILGNMNYEGGCNPVNVAYLTGLGRKRQRVIVSQYADNDRHILPPSGIPLGAIQEGFQCWNPYYGCELGPLCHPLDGAQTAKYPFYDRWGDAFNVSTEFVCPNMTRSLAALTYLATQTSLQTQSWIPVQGSVSLPPSPWMYSTITASLTAPGMNLDAATAVWELQGLEPGFGEASSGHPFSFVPTTAGAFWIEAEAELPDGRRVFGTNTIAVSNPNGAAGEYTPNVNETIALYHFNGNYNDSSANALHLSASPGINRAAAAFWLATPSGEVARFSSGGQQLTVAIPDSLILNQSPYPLSIEAWIYPRAFQTPPGNNTLLELRQDDDAQFSIKDDPGWDKPAGIYVYGPWFDASHPSPPLVTPDLWQANVPPYHWHLVQILYDNGNLNCFVDGKRLNPNPVSLPVNYSRTSSWTLKIGNFDGDIDEVRISKILQPVPSPKVSIVATKPNASEAGPDAGYFTVFRSGATADALTVNCTISGTAANGTDYTTLQTSVTIPGGASSTTIPVTPIDDTTSEPNETVVLTLSADPAYTIGNSGSATVTIADNAD